MTTGYFSFLKPLRDLVPNFIPYGGRLFSAAKSMEPDNALSVAVRSTRMILSLDKQFALSGLNSFFPPSKMSSNGTDYQASHCCKLILESKNILIPHIHVHEVFIILTNTDFDNFLMEYFYGLSTLIQFEAQATLQVTETMRFPSGD